MSKIIGVENTERINAELEKLIEEVKQRTKTTITGVRIPDLGEAQTIDGSEMIIIEGKAGTQRTLATNIPNQEVIDSRGGEQTLGDRLDKIVKNINDNTNNIIANANAINISNKEVIDARTDNQVPSTTYPTLKDRIDGIETTANQANNTANANALQINTINTTQAQHENRIDLLEQNNGVIQEVVDARTNANGVTKTNLKTRLDDEYNTLNGLIATNTGNITKNKNNITSVTNEVTQARNGHPDLKTRIDGIENDVQNIQGSVNTINNNVANLTTKVGSVETAIKDATGKFANLKTRLDSINTTATNAQTSATNANNGVATLTNTTNDHEKRIEKLENASGASVNQEVVDARGGETTLGNRLDKMTTATTDAKAVADKADAKSIQNETRINNILNSMISFRVI